MAGECRGGCGIIKYLLTIFIILYPFQLNNYYPPKYDLSYPCRCTITSGFGFRKLRGRGRMHYGIDLKAAYGSSVYSADTGTVIFSGKKSGYGNTIIIDHGNEIYTLYAHNSALLATIGQNVNQGEAIAKIGNTGYSTGPHLHYEIRWRNKAVNPLFVLDYINRNFY